MPTRPADSELLASSTASKASCSLDRFAWRPIAARRILGEICATQGADEYNELGACQAFVDPPDERAALESWEQSLTLNPRSADVLNRMAYVRLFPNDSTLYSPIAAVYLADLAEMLGAATDSTREVVALHLPG